MNRFLFLICLILTSVNIISCDIDKNVNEPLFDDCNIKQVNPNNQDNGTNVTVGTKEVEQ